MKYKYQQAIDHLAEARRYVRSNPAVARDCHLSGRKVLVDRIIKPDDPGQREKVIDRLLTNMLIGQECRLSDPDVFIGYLTGAIHELQNMGWED